jgi:hypothetical protein
MEEGYIGSKEEEMDEEGRIVDEETRRESTLCANCLDRQWTKVIKGSHLCLECAERYPNGMPF